MEEFMDKESLDNIFNDVKENKTTTFLDEKDIKDISHLMAYNEYMKNENYINASEVLKKLSDKK